MSSEPETGPGTAAYRLARAELRSAKAREHDQHETQHPDATEEQEMPDRCQCGHTWEYHGPEVPGCCECTCRDLPSSKESA